MTAMCTAVMPDQGIEICIVNVNHNHPTCLCSFPANKLTTDVSMDISLLHLDYVILF